MAPIVLIFQTHARAEAFSTNIIRVIFVSIILSLVSAPGTALRRVRGKQPTQVLQARARLLTTAMIPLALTLPPATKLLFIKDPLSHISFMIDTGSQVSLIPCQRALQHSSVTGFLRSANGSRIPVFEDVTLNVSLNVNRCFRWNFKTARVRTAIIGIEFLSHFGQLVDAKLRAVRDGMAKPLQQSARVPPNRSVDRGGLFTEAGAESLSASVEARSDSPPGSSAIGSLQELLEQFNRLFDLSNFGRPVQHETRHYIPTKGLPVPSKCLRLSSEKLVVLKRELNKLLE